MRFIDKSRLKLDPSWILQGQAKVQEHKIDYLADKDQYKLGNKKLLIDSSIYTKIKSELLNLQHTKCCYCEWGLQNSNSDVEHYRPKSESKQANKTFIHKIGYYWLAYDVENLLVSCQKCNQTYKKTLFPLVLAHTRCIGHDGDINLEQPLLLNPSVDDPSQHLFFENEYLLHRTQRGKVTIKVLQLNRNFLLEDRADTLLQLRLLDKIVSLSSSREKHIYIRQLEKNIDLAKLGVSKYSKMILDNF